MTYSGEHHTLDGIAKCLRGSKRRDAVLEEVVGRLRVNITTLLCAETEGIHVNKMG